MDFVVVTASTPAQAASYRALVGARVASGVYPSHIHFRFYCDPPGGRVGSGGGTMLALAQLLAEEACGEDGQRPAAVGQQAAVDFFSARRILLVHAGGESRRLPCYVPEVTRSSPTDCTSPSPPLPCAQVKSFVRR
jgi:fucokinase